MQYYRVNKDTGLDLSGIRILTGGQPVGISPISITIPKDATLMVNSDRTTIYKLEGLRYRITIPENQMVHLTPLPAMPPLMRQNAIRVHNNDDLPPGGGSAMMVNRRSTRRSTRRSKRRSTRRARR
jgi:hypothetical protein